jgi:hypothetical protein
MELTKSPPIRVTILGVSSVGSAKATSGFMEIPPTTPTKAAAVLARDSLREMDPSDLLALLGCATPPKADALEIAAATKSARVVVNLVMMIIGS